MSDTFTPPSEEPSLPPSTPSGQPLQVPTPDSANPLPAARPSFGAPATPEFSETPTVPLISPAPDWTPRPARAPYAPLPPVELGPAASLATPTAFGGRVAALPPRRRVALLALALLVVLALGVGLGSAIASGRTSSPSAAVSISTASTTTSSTGSTESAATVQQSVESVLQSVEPAVVEITSTGGNGEAIGSGDILTSNGYIVTNDHVVQGYSNFTVTLSNGTNDPATLVGQDPANDLAVLKINATNLKAITLGDSAKAQVGEFVVAVGNPLGLTQSATFGIVSALNRSASEAPSGPAGELTGLIQTSAQLNPGNSGGALVNLQGQLIGIPTLGATDSETGTAAQGIGYAIPSDQVATIANQLIASGHVTNTGESYLGVQAQDVTAQVAQADGLSVQSGALVIGFANDAAGQSPAQQAGVQTGDVITAVNGQPIASSADLATALATLSPGTKATLTLERGSSSLTVSVTLGERPA